MKIVIFGATGRTGIRLVEQALAQEHDVTAFVRNPSKLNIKNKKLSVVQGDVTNPEQVQVAVEGKDAVLSALGLSKSSPKTVCSHGMRNIIAAMKKHGARRLVCESAFGAGDTKNHGIYTKLLWLIIKDIMEDKNKMEDIVKNSNLDWIVVRPTILTNGPKTGNYKGGLDIEFGIIPKISRADVADFMLRQIGEDRFLHKIPVVSY